MDTGTSGVLDLEHGRVDAKKEERVKGKQTCYRDIWQVRAHEQLSRDQKQAIRQERHRLARDENKRLLSLPLGQKAQAIKMDKRGRKRALDRGNMRDRKVSREAFKRYMETTHEQRNYAEIAAVPFQVDKYDMMCRIKQAIRARKTNMAVGPYGTHVEMLQADQAVCADFPTARRLAIGRTGVFPEQWSQGTICRLYKKGSQSDPANYIPVCPLSHIWKTVDRAVLATLNDQLCLSPSQFGFQAGDTIAQDLLEAEDNAKGGMRHADILDLEKPADKVERHLLMSVVAT